MRSPSGRSKCPRVGRGWSLHPVTVSLRKGERDRCPEGCEWRIPFPPGIIPIIEIILHDLGRKAGPQQGENKNGEVSLH
tara:strand:+ start:5755 stop:5991 length:237 start_codon:yes stop_codon:yes gene_type:complete